MMEDPQTTGKLLLDFAAIAPQLTVSPPA